MADEIINEEVLISTETLSHFKVKQDLENENKFKKKDDATDLKGAVRYDAAQVLTEEQKAQARANIGAGTSDITESGEGAVRYDVQQALDEDDKARARANIGATDGTWESMPDKPFGKTGYKYEWDGNTDGLEVLGVVEGFDFYKVSSDVISQDELLGASVKVCFDDDYIEGEITQDGNISVVQTSTGNLIVLNGGQLPILCVLAQTGEDTFATTTFTVETTGLWFLHSTEQKGFTQYLQKNYSVKKIDKEFLPDDINVELPEGLVTTDENGLIPTSMLPSYVDDVIEGYYNTEDSLFYEEAEFTTAIIGETGKIYTDLASRDIYRWSGSVFVQINPKTYRLATNDDIDALFSK